MHYETLLTIGAISAHIILTARTILILPSLHAAASFTGLTQGRGQTIGTARRPEPARKGNMYRSLLAAAVVPLVLGDYSYSYDAPTAAPTAETQHPTATMAPTRTETYARRA